MDESDEIGVTDGGVYNSVYSVHSRVRWGRGMFGVGVCIYE